MKKILGIVVALFLCSNLFSQGIEFQHVSFKEVLEKAKAENKMVFMDCYTTWCGPCKALAKNVFPQKEVGEYYNANFVNLKMDMEKGEGPDLLKKYDVKGFPTLLFIDADGNVLYKRVGGGSAKDLITDAKKATDPTERIDYVKKKYEEGDRSEEIVMKYIALLAKNKLKEELKKVGMEYLSTITNEDLLQAENFKTLSIVGAKFQSEKFQYVFTNKEKFVAVVGEEPVNQLIMYTYYYYLQEVAGGNDFEKLESTIAEYNKLFADPRNEYMYKGLYAEHYIANKQFDKWFEAAEKNTKEAESEGDEKYTSLLMRNAYTIIRDARFEAVPEAYNKAILWVNTIIERDANFKGVDVALAQLYLKDGDKNNAAKYLKIYKEKNSSFSERDEKFYNSLKEEIEKM